jgi:ribosome-binding protein aMBF1 (putative translation factor)
MRSISAAARSARGARSAQVRAARAWLGWTRADLARTAELSVESIRDFEIGRTDPRASTLAKIEAAFRAAGLLLFDANRDGGPGIREEGG